MSVYVLCVYSIVNEHVGRSHVATVYRAKL